MGYLVGAGQGSPRTRRMIRSAGPKS